MKKGFTLLELVVVIVIVGILATLGLVQYTKVMEKSRTAEAKSALGLLRRLEVAYYQDKATYGGVANLIGTGLPWLSTGCTTTHYFTYSCATLTGTCSATRCTTGGKDPQGTLYTIRLTTGGVFSETGP